MPESFNDKATARSRFVNDRLTLGNHVRCEASLRLGARLLDAPELVHAAVVCVYASFGTEPDTSGLIETLIRRGVRILLPVLREDRDLDWARFDGELAPGRLGLREPPGERLGVDALCDADVVLVPALAVSALGERLGRGGGSYDRALARVAVAVKTAATLKTAARQKDQRARPWVCALVYDGELDARFPVEAHDRPVAAACAPSRLVRFPAGG